MSLERIGVRCRTRGLTVLLGYALVDVSATRRWTVGTGDGVERNMAIRGVTVVEEVEVAARDKGKGSKVVLG